MLHDHAFTRRQIMTCLAGLGVGPAVFRRALAAQAEGATKVTAEMIRQAEWISGISLDDKARESVATSVNNLLRDFTTNRAVTLDNRVPPALAFNPAPWLPPAAHGDRGKCQPSTGAAVKRPTAEDDLAFLPVTSLATLVRTKQVSSVELTKLYLERLHKYDSALKCVVSFTDDLAMRQAEAADREIAAGRYRGPLHGIPWGAKDLIAVPGYRTTWGAGPYREQVIDAKATVAQRLEDAGAVLIAKLTLGALAMGDGWFGGMTRNPWNPKQGSSGSSAGSAAAVAAGLVGFAIGSETLGSIVSPCTRCGATGLRPTFGRVSRAGCMTLSWSMDKLGPITRSVEDCALVLGAIHGFDGTDACAMDRPFHWPPQRDLKALKVGFLELRNGPRERPELKVLRDLGVDPVPIKLPSSLPVQSLRFILGTEAATAFDELTRRGVSEGIGTWPSTFRQGEFVPAVEYLRANRLRSLLMSAMAEVMKEIDVYLVGSGMSANADLLLTNLTGHPTVVMPNGLVRSSAGDGQKGQSDGDRVETPTSITFTGRLYGETDLLSLAKAYQDATGHHLKRPPMEKLIG